MGTVNVVFCNAGQIGLYGPLPAYGGDARASENITSGASSAASTNAAQDGEFVRITALDAAVYATLGASPTAAAGTTWLVPVGASLDLKAKAGEKVAVINA